VACLFAKRNPEYIRLTTVKSLETALKKRSLKTPEADPGSLDPIVDALAAIAYNRMEFSREAIRILEYILMQEKVGRKSYKNVALAFNGFVQENLKIIEPSIVETLASMLFYKVGGSFDARDAYKHTIKALATIAKKRPDLINSSLVNRLTREEKSLKSWTVRRISLFL